MITTVIPSGDKPRKRALLIYAGWGMDPQPFVGLSRPGYDIAVAWNHTDATPPQGLDGYEEVVVLAWSFGVAEAARWLVTRPANVTKAVAVNGTPWPVDDRRGIPKAVYEGTLAGLNDRNLRKFMVRMCGGMTPWKAFEPVAPNSRTLANLTAELEATGHRPAPGDDAVTLFDSVYIGGADAIIPAEAQREAWRNHCHVTELPDTPHLPDFASIITAEFIAKPMVGRRFGRAAGTYTESASVQADVAAKLEGLWSDLEPGRSYGHVIEVGSGTGIFTRLYSAERKIERLTLWDIAECPAENYPAGSAFSCTDAETAITMQPDGSADAVVSSSTLQWFNSPRRFMREVARVLRPGGMAVLSAYGADTFGEIAALQPSRLPYLDQAGWVAIIPDSLETLFVGQERLPLRFGSASEMAAHLRQTGVNATGGGSVAAARALMRITDPILTYHPIYMVLRKRYNEK